MHRRLSPLLFSAICLAIFLHLGRQRRNDHVAKHTWRLHFASRHSRRLSRCWSIGLFLLLYLYTCANFLDFLSATGFLLALVVYSRAQRACFSLAFLCLYDEMRAIGYHEQQVTDEGASRLKMTKQHLCTRYDNVYESRLPSKIEHFSRFFSYLLASGRLGGWAMLISAFL